jgi:hypothetical protein
MDAKNSEIRIEGLLEGYQGEGYMKDSHFKPEEGKIQSGEIREITNKLRGPSNVCTINFSDQLGSKDDFIKSFKDTYKKRRRNIGVSNKKAVHLAEGGLLW